MQLAVAIEDSFIFRKIKTYGQAAKLIKGTLLSLWANLQVVMCCSFSIAGLISNETLTLK